MRSEGTAHHKRCQDEILAQDTSVCTQIPAPTIDLTISEQQVEAQLLQSPLEIRRKYCLCFDYLLSILLCLTPLMPASYRLLKVLLPPHFPEMWTQSWKGSEVSFSYSKRGAADAICGSQTLWLGAQHSLYWFCDLQKLLVLSGWLLICKMQRIILLSNSNVI